MAGVAIVDRFLETFTSHIDSGFGLLRPEVAYLASALIVIDLVLVFSFAAWSNEDVLQRLAKKVLYVGFFAYLINHYSVLTGALFKSMAGLGLLAAGSSVSISDFVHPGRLASVGIESARPLLDAISGLMGYVSFFENFVQIAILLLAWAVVIVSFFVLAITLFVTLVEFKISTLAGFVLVAFGFWNKSAFLAERVLGNVMGSGIKVLVLALVVGIGSTLFAEMRAALPPEPSIDDALTIMLASLTLMAVGLFSVSIASGLTSGAPQLGAGAAVGTALTAAGLGYGAAAGGAALVRGGAAIGRATGMMANKAQQTRDLRSSIHAQYARLHAQPVGAAASAGAAPAWAQQMRRGHGLHAAHIAKGFTHQGGGQGATPKLDNDES